MVDMHRWAVSLPCRAVPTSDWAPALSCMTKCRLSPSHWLYGWTWACDEWVSHASGSNRAAGDLGLDKRHAIDLNGSSHKVHDGVQNFTLKVLEMEFLQDAFREGDSFDSTRTTDTITLDITYDDPELHALLSVVSTDWASETLKESLKQGRLTNDLWALGLPLPDDVTNVCIVEDKYLRVRVVVICDQLVVRPHTFFFLTSA